MIQLNCHTLVTYDDISKSSDDTPINMSQMVRCENHAAYSLQNESGNILEVMLESCMIPAVI